MENIMSAYAEVPAVAVETGYEMKTTFWGDFTVAERLSGIAGVKDTFKRAFKGWKDNEVYLYRDVYGSQLESMATLSD